ncbi:MAG: 8-amino-7-oxononanoate synthase [Candidatus Aldehydirespiratoraceae bacterium]
MTAFADWTESQLTRIRDAGQWRVTRTFDALGPVGQLDGREVVSFASNDYLGLSSHPAVMDAAKAAIDKWGAGATASRLVVGSRPVHDELEAELSSWKDTEAALIFPTGFATNIGLLATLGGPDCLVVSDELNHASIIDGCRMSRSPIAVASHNDVEHVDRLLAERTTDRAIVVADAVFSMDGDEAPVIELGEVCARHGALLILDEAHSVFGPALEPLSDIDGLDLLRVVTLSKGLGAMGGAACGNRAVIDLLINRTRPFIFTTALSPADTAAALAAVQITRSAEGTALIERVRGFTDQLSPGHPSPIVPIVVGTEADTVAAAAALLEAGILVPAIRPPTVAPGTSRLRVTLSAAHTQAQVDALIAGLTSAELMS